MKRLVLLVLLLSLLLAALTVGVRAYSQSRPEDSSAILHGYGLCDGSPCFLGIKPGVTTWDEAKKVVRAYYPDAIIYDAIIIVISGSDRILITEHKNIVYEIETDQENVQPSLSAVIAKLGEPCYVDIYLTTCMGDNCPVDYIELHYNSGFIGLNIASDIISTSTEIARLSLDLPVDQILLSPRYAAPKTPQACLELLNKGTDAQLATPWLGFASIRRRYLSYAELRK